MQLLLGAGTAAAVSVYSKTAAVPHADIHRTPRARPVRIRAIADVAKHAPMKGGRATLSSDAFLGAKWCAHEED